MWMRSLCHCVSFISFFASFFVSLLHLTGMDMISLEGKTNFFEKRVGEYQKSGVMNNLERESGAGGGVKELDFGADF